MIISDLHYRMVENLQHTGTGISLYDTTTRIHSIASSTASGYQTCIVLPAMPFMAMVTVVFYAKISTGGSGVAEIHSHNSPYYGATFTVSDRAIIDNDSDFKLYKMRYVMTSQGGRIYPRVMFGADSTATLEIKGSYVEIEYEGDVRLTDVDRRLRGGWFGPDFSSHQGITVTTTGSGTVTYDAVANNYTEFVATGSDTAFVTIDNVEGFEVNLNTEFYVIEIDARVAAQSEEAVARFVFKDAVGGDNTLRLVLTETSDSSYQTYRFFVVQDGFPATIDSVELEVGSMGTNQTTYRVREVRIRSYGLTTANLKPIGTDAACAVVVNSGTPAFDENYRRSNLTGITTSGPNTVDITVPYRSGKIMVPTMTAQNSAIRPVVLSITTSLMKIQFYDSAGSLVPLASLPANYTFFIHGEM